MEKIKIPYIVIDTRGEGETSIECESVCKDDLDERLLKVLQEYQTYNLITLKHPFYFLKTITIFLYIIYFI